MKKLVILGLFGCLTLAGCRTPKSGTASVTQNKPLTTIAFGSCSDQKRPQPLWDDIVAQKPDLWIWLGDNIYGDSENMDTLRAKYARQKSNPVYQQLRQSTPIIGVWDDHDYGVNDGGKEYPKRKESQQLMLDFLDVPVNQSITQAGRGLLRSQLRAERATGKSNTAGCPLLPRPLEEGRQKQCARPIGRYAGSSAMEMAGAATDRTPMPTCTLLVVVFRCCPKNMYTRNGPTFPRPASACWI